MAPSAPSPTTDGFCGPTDVSVPSGYRRADDSRYSEAERCSIQGARASVACLLALIAFAVASRFCCLSYPAQVVFDETGFGKRVNAYGWTGERLFDIHPPHGKLLITGVARLGAYNGSIDFARIGNPAEAILPLRLLPAFTGACIPLLVLILLRQIGASSAAGLVGGSVVALDNAFVVQSRMVGVDSLLVFFILATIVTVLAARKVSGARRIGLFILAGSLGGLAAGTKFTGLVALGIGSLAIVDGWWRYPTSRWARYSDGAAFIGMAVAIYVLGWVVHFHLMIVPTADDAFFRPRGDLAADLFQIHKVMFLANSGLKAAHSYASFWWQWPLMKKPIYYWAHGDAGIYFIGNPIIWWSVAAGFLILLGCLIFGGGRHSGRAHPNDRIPMLWLPIAGALMCIIPLIPVRRPLFMYHYLPTLAFAIIALVLWLDRSVLDEQSSLRRPMTWYVGCIACSGASFAVISPITYGLGWLKPFHAVLKWSGYGP